MLCCITFFYIYYVVSIQADTPGTLEKVEFGKRDKIFLEPLSFYEVCTPLVIQMNCIKQQGLKRFSRGGSIGFLKGLNVEHKIHHTVQHHYQK